MARSISLMKIFCLLLCQSQHAGLLDFSPISTSRQRPPRKGLATLCPAPSPWVLAADDDDGAGARGQRKLCSAAPNAAVIRAD